jgi:hypothetical protein
VNLARAALLIVVADAIAIAAMLLVRRRAPDGSAFTNGDRASGVFGVLATGFALLLGFIVFLAFESYDNSRAGAEDEARIVAQQIETAQFFDEDSAKAFTGELVCYARSVIHTEWPAMEDGQLGEHINPWSVALFRTLKAVDPQTPAEQEAYSKWFDQTFDREDARQERVHGAAGVLPTPLWIALFFLAAVLFVYTLFFADSGEGRVAQGMLMGSVVTTMVTLLLLLTFLDNPYHPGTGSLRPDAMQRTSLVLDQELEIAGLAQSELPCDVSGNAT